MLPANKQDITITAILFFTESLNNFEQVGEAADKQLGRDKNSEGLGDQEKRPGNQGFKKRCVVDSFDNENGEEESGGKAI